VGKKALQPPPPPIFGKRGEKFMPRNNVRKIFKQLGKKVSVFFRKRGGGGVFKEKVFPASIPFI